MRAISRPPSEALPARIASLAVLPVFFGLAGRPVVVVGGSDGAAWKAELLLATGAEVHVFAPAEEMGEEWARLAGILISVNVLSGFVTAVYAAVIASAVRRTENALL